MKKTVKIVIFVNHRYDYYKVFIISNIIIYSETCL